MFFIYRYLTFILYPFFILLIYLRVVLKKEDKIKFKEKIFSSNFKSVRNIKNKLIWFHAASIGEISSVIPLIKAINNSKKNIDFLITTVTLSSAQLVGRELSQYSNITHRFFPLDTANLSKKFLEAWTPDLVCFIDSEIWPNFLFKIKKKKIPLVLINGRITRKTFDKWKIFPIIAKKVFSNFDLCLTSSEESKNNLDQLHLANIEHIGNLKFTVKNKALDINDVNKKILDKFKVWCAVSTHEGEELIALKTHVKIKENYNNIFTIIIPRHINRVSYIKNLSNKFNLKAQILKDGDKINVNTEILIINSFGVLSKYFNYCKNIFIGKSLIKKLRKEGGQNPIEAAKAGCKILHGPYIYNFQEIYNFLNSSGISCQINNEKELVDKIIDSFKYPKKIDNHQIDLLNAYGDKILKQTTDRLNKFI